jgi:hypothetical protein
VKLNIKAMPREAHILDRSADAESLQNPKSKIVGNQQEAGHGRWAGLSATRSSRVNVQVVVSARDFKRPSYIPLSHPKTETVSVIAY